MSRPLATTKVRCPRCGTLHALSVVDGKALRVRREKTGLSLRDMARRVGITPAFLSDIELGRRQPSPSVARSLAAVLVKGGEEKGDDR